MNEFLITKDAKLKKIKMLENEIAPRIKIQTFPLKEKGLAIDDGVDNYLIVISKDHQVLPSDIRQEENLAQMIGIL